MTPTNLPSEITNRAPTCLSAIISTASYTQASGDTDQMSWPFCFNTDLTVSTRSIGFNTRAATRPLDWNLRSQLYLCAGLYPPTLVPHLRCILVLQPQSSPCPPRGTFGGGLIGRNEVYLLFQAVLLPAVTMQDALPLLNHRGMSAQIGGCVLGIQAPQDGGVTEQILRASGLPVRRPGLALA